MKKLLVMDTQKQASDLLRRLEADTHVWMAASPGMAVTGHSFYDVIDLTTPAQSSSELARKVEWFKNVERNLK